MPNDNLITPYMVANISTTPYLKIAGIDPKIAKEERSKLIIEFNNALRESPPWVIEFCDEFDLETAKEINIPANISICFNNLKNIDAVKELNNKLQACKLHTLQLKNLDTLIIQQLTIPDPGQLQLSYLDENAIEALILPTSTQTQICLGKLTQAAFARLIPKIQDKETIEISVASIKDFSEFYEVLYNFFADMQSKVKIPKVIIFTNSLTISEQEMNKMKNLFDVLWEHQNLKSTNAIFSKHIPGRNQISAKEKFLAAVREIPIIIPNSSPLASTGPIILPDQIPSQLKELPERIKPDSILRTINNSNNNNIDVSGAHFFGRKRTREAVHGEGDQPDNTKRQIIDNGTCYTN